MTRKPGDEKSEPTEDRAAERFREFVDQRFPEGIEHSPLPVEEDEASFDEAYQNEGDQDPDAESAEGPLGEVDYEQIDASEDHAAERLREFVDQRFPEGIEHSPLPENAATESSVVSNDVDVATAAEAATDGNVEEDNGENTGEESSREKDNSEGQP